VEHRLCEAHALAEALRQLADELAGDVTQAAAAADLLDAPRALGRIHLTQIGRELEVLEHRHVAVDGRVLGQVPDAPAHLEGVLEDVEARDLGAAGGRREVAGQHLHGRRLAGAVRAQEAEDLALVDLERHVVDGSRGAVVLGEALDLYHHVRHGRPFLVWGDLRPQPADIQAYSRRRATLTGSPTTRPRGLSSWPAPGAGKIKARGRGSLHPFWPRSRWGSRDPPWRRSRRSRGRGGRRRCSERRRPSVGRACTGRHRPRRRRGRWRAGRRSLPRPAYRHRSSARSRDRRRSCSRAGSSRRRPGRP
jgi:hypothetical protein